MSPSPLRRRLQQATFWQWECWDLSFPLLCASYLMFSCWRLSGTAWRILPLPRDAKRLWSWSSLSLLCFYCASPRVTLCWWCITSSCLKGRTTTCMGFTSRPCAWPVSTAVLTLLFTISSPKTSGSTWRTHSCVEVSGQRRGWGSPSALWSSPKKATRIRQGQGTHGARIVSEFLIYLFF